MPLLRLDKIIADTGHASRKEAKALIKSGRVTVDGISAVSAEDKFDPEAVELRVDGERLQYSRHHYYMLNKPAGVLSATEDAGQATVLDLLAPELQRLGIFPAGRLDKDTTGLLLLTNDGDFAHRITSPKHNVPKLYYARVDGTIDGDDVSAFAAGVILKDGTQCRPAKLRILEGRGDEAEVTLSEGKYHQVKRMLASRGKPVMELRRLEIGGLKLDDSLIPGEYRSITAFEKDLIFQRKSNNLAD